MRPEKSGKVGWLEYKTVRQYQSMGDLLERFRVYGFSAGMASIAEMNKTSARNGHDWLTQDPSC